MKVERIETVLTEYEKKLSIYGAPCRHTVAGVIPSDTQAARHVLWMCREVRGFLAKGSHDRAVRWLDFIQGVLWKCGQYGVLKWEDS